MLAVSISTHTHTNTNFPVIFQTRKVGFHSPYLGLKMGPLSRRYLIKAVMGLN